MHSLITQSSTTPLAWTDRRAELVGRIRITPPSVVTLASRVRAMHGFVLHSRSALPTEIPQRFTFSLLPPSFAAGRCATFFFSAAGVPGAGRHAA